MEVKQTLNVGFVALWPKTEKVTVCKVEDGTSALTLSQADSKCLNRATRFKFTAITMTIRFILQRIFLEQLFGAKDTGENKA